MHFYLIVNASKSGYNAGTGGTLLIQLETDDGSSAHNPSGVVLGSATIPNPSANFPEVALSSAPQLTAGNLYHLVFTNIDPNPTANYVSVDELYMYKPLSPMQPTWNSPMATSLNRGPYQQAQSRCRQARIPIMSG